MKILYVSFSNTQGMINYSKVYVENNLDSYLISGFYGNQLHDNRVLNKYGPKKSRSVFEMLNIIKLIKLCIFIKKHKFTIIHFLSSHPWNLFLIYFTNLKYIHTIHDPISHPNEKRSRIINLYNLLIYKSKKVNILIHGKIFVNYLTTKKIETSRIFYVPLATENKQSFYISNKFADVFTILFFGRIKPYKGLDNFIKITKTLKNEGLIFKSVIAGEGNLQQYLDKNDEKQFEIFNYLIPEDQVKNFFSSASLIILPYHSSTQSGIILQSYFYSKPVIVSDVGALSDYVLEGVSGYICKTIDCMIHHIKELYYNPKLLEDLSKSTLKYFNDNLSIEVVFNNINSIYRSIK